MAFSPFPIRPWPFDPVPTYPAQITYRVGHEIAQKRWMAATFFQLFLNAQLAALKAQDAACRNCPRDWKCQMGKLADAAGAIVRYMQQWGFVEGPPYPLRFETLAEVVGATQDGSRIMNGISSTAPIAPAALEQAYALAAGVRRWTLGREQIPTNQPPPWWPTPHLRPVPCLTGACGCGYEVVPWLHPAR